METSTVVVISSHVVAVGQESLHAQRDREPESTGSLRRSVGMAAGGFYSTRPGQVAQGVVE